MLQDDVAAFFEVALDDVRLGQALQRREVAIQQRHALGQLRHRRVARPVVDLPSGPGGVSTRERAERQRARGFARAAAYIEHGGLERRQLRQLDLLLADRGGGDAGGGAHGAAHGGADVSDGLPTACACARIYARITPQRCRVDSVCGVVFCDSS